MNKIRQLIATIAILSLLHVSGYAQSKPDTSARGLPLETVDTTKLGEPSPAQFAAQIRECSSTALLIKEASKALEDAHDGSPESATKIALVKLKLLERISKALPLAVRELERFRHRALIEESRHEADQTELWQQMTTVKGEIDDLSNQVKEVNGELMGDDATIALLAMKIERLEEMAIDQKASQLTTQSIQRTLETMNQLESRISSYRDITREEVQRQIDAVRRSRVARNSALLNSEAEFLISAVQSLDIPLAGLPRTNPSLVVPETASVSLPKPASSITPELRAKVLAAVRTNNKANSSAKQDEKTSEVKQASFTNR
jgi:hypothetical protein